MKLKELYFSVKSINALLEEKNIPVKASFKISTILKKVNRYLETFNEQENKLVKELGEIKEDGSMSVKPENMEEFNKKIEELLDVDIPDITKINISELEESDKKPNIKPGIFFDLDWLFTE